MIIFKILTRLKDKLTKSPYLWGGIIVGGAMFLTAWVLGLLLQVAGSVMSMGEARVRPGPFSCLWTTLSKGLVLYLIICIALVVGYFVSYKKLMTSDNFDERGFKGTADGLYGTSKWLGIRELENKGFIVTEDIEQINGYILGYKEEDDD